MWLCSTAHAPHILAEGKLGCLNKMSNNSSLKVGIQNSCTVSDLYNSAVKQIQTSRSRSTDQGSESRTPNSKLTIFVSPLAHVLKIPLGLGTSCGRTSWSRIQKSPTTKQIYSWSSNMKKSDATACHGLDSDVAEFFGQEPHAGCTAFDNFFNRLGVTWPEYCALGQECSLCDAWQDLCRFFSTASSALVASPRLLPWGSGHLLHQGFSFVQCGQRAFGTPLMSSGHQKQTKVSIGAFISGSGDLDLEAFLQIF